MSDLRKAAQMALIVLRCIEYDSCETVVDGPDKYMCDDAYDALRAALEQPEPEPVAYLWQHCVTERTRIIEKDQVWTASNPWNRVGPLYLHPPQRKPLTEEEIITCAIKDAFGIE
jgi:hypothetical protein